MHAWVRTWVLSRSGVLSSQVVLTSNILRLFQSTATTTVHQRITDSWQQFSINVHQISLVSDLNTVTVDVWDLCTVYIVHSQTEPKPVKHNIGLYLSKLSSDLLPSSVADYK